MAGTCSNMKVMPMTPWAAPMYRSPYHSHITGGGLLERNCLAGSRKNAFQNFAGSWFIPCFFKSPPSPDMYNTAQTSTSISTTYAFWLRGFQSFDPFPEPSIAHAPAKHQLGNRRDATPQLGAVFQRLSRVPFLSRNLPVVNGS